MSSKETAAATFSGFEVLFTKMEDAKHADLLRASAEIARLSEPIQALAEATAEIGKPHFTTYIST